jgi:mono/diheme cytochrome c family protein
VSRIENGRRGVWRRGGAGVALLAALAATAVPAEELSSYTGAQLYARFCASCHGADGRGEGPVAPALKVIVPDLTRLVRREGDAFPAEQVRRIVDGRDIRAAHGARRMPVWGYEFASATVSEPDAGAREASALIDRIIDHLRAIQRPRGAP